MKKILSWFDTYTVTGRLATVVSTLLVILAMIFLPRLVVDLLGIMLFPILILLLFAAPLIHYIIYGNGENSAALFIVMIFVIILLAFTGFIGYDVVTGLFRMLYNGLVASGWICTVGCRG